MVQRTRPKRYDVGYGRPPKRTQFKPGQSGNPKGRPKATNNLKTDLGHELAEHVRITENGRDRRISKQRLVIKSLVAKAVKGDTRASALLIDLIAKTVGFDPQTDRSPELSRDDQALIDIFLARTASGALEPPTSPTEKTVAGGTSPERNETRPKVKRVPLKRLQPKRPISTRQRKGMT